jgi:hypothetical protein
VDHHPLRPTAGAVGRVLDRLTAAHSSHNVNRFPCTPHSGIHALSPRRVRIERASFTYFPCSILPSCSKRLRTKLEPISPLLWDDRSSIHPFMKSFIRAIFSHNLADFPEYSTPYFAHLVRTLINVRTTRNIAPAAQRLRMPYGNQVFSVCVARDELEGLPDRRVG